MRNSLLLESPQSGTQIEVGADSIEYAHFELTGENKNLEDMTDIEFENALMHYTEKKDLK